MVELVGGGSDINGATPSSLSTSLLAQSSLFWSKTLSSRTLHNRKVRQEDIYRRRDARGYNDGNKGETTRTCPVDQKKSRYLPCA